ncbi:MAG: hypothetical protein NVSMB17_10560 [Candidatus Dormibacteria bacterium]
MLVDPSLRVMEISEAAADFFATPVLPASLVSLTRSASIEGAARSALEGRLEPVEIALTHHRCVFMVRASLVPDQGVLLQFEDVTELRRLEAMRADFVANLAHELRTPIASLSLAAETLTTDLPPHQQRRFIERIAEETHYIEGLLRSVSELALLEDDVVLNLTEFPLRAAVDETWARVTDRQGPCPLECEVSSEVVVTADRVRLLEVLQNLMENAHRFSPAGKPVRVGAGVRGGEVELWIDDQGPGIPPAELPRVFERFYKVDRARTRRGDGSGLGLAIAKHLVSAHGGRILAAAGNEGGTRITFTLATGIPTSAG